MPPALLCLSHLRWDFVYQRPNHLMARAARDRRVYFVEEPIHEGGEARLDRRQVDGVTVVSPVLPEGVSDDATQAAMSDLLQGFVAREGVVDPWLWYYTPMALPWSRGIEASGVVYDCMDELTGFRGAPVELVRLERELFGRADIVFTGGRSLYEAKAGQHPRVHAMPSAVDVAHFATARRPGADPDDQAGIARPRIGYYGVIDERIDGELISEVARLRPDWHVVLVGPVAKLSREEVPAGPNIHRLGMKRYEELPAYLRGWDVAVMPFALNESTRYISPTKTPEYLAGGRPVVSTPIRDVVHPYGDLDLVRIASTPDEFVAATEAALQDDLADLRARADGLLAEMSWDATWARMDGLVRTAIAERSAGRVLVPASPTLAPSRTSAPSRTAVPSLTRAPVAPTGDRLPLRAPLPARLGLGGATSAGSAARAASVVAGGAGRSGSSSATSQAGLVRRRPTRPSGSVL
jgi:glycosyltransferase involved in cell wall biosynthesis